MTQLYAMIKKNTKYYSQRTYHTDNKGKPIPFDIEIDEKETNGYAAKGGVGGQYPIKDLNFYVKVNGKFTRI